jgi:hypothetical protein
MRRLQKQLTLASAMLSDDASVSVLLAEDFEEGLDLPHTWVLTSIESFTADDGLVSTSPHGLPVRASGNWDAPDRAIAPVDHDCGHACAPVSVRPPGCAPLRARLQEPAQMVGPAFPKGARDQPAVLSDAVARSVVDASSG